MRGTGNRQNHPRALPWRGRTPAVRQLEHHILELPHCGPGRGPPLDHSEYGGDHIRRVGEGFPVAACDRDEESIDPTVLQGLGEVTDRGRHGEER